MHRYTFSKLFAPNDVVVKMEDEHPRAYIAQSVSFSGTTAVLDCWTWNFDGSFQKVQKPINVTWPTTGADEVSILSLSAWPLRYDDSDLRERLLKRGQQFWSCRNQRLVNYRSPTPSIFELQVVSHHMHLILVFHILVAVLFTTPPPISSPTRTD